MPRDQPTLPAAHDGLSPLDRWLAGARLAAIPLAVAAVATTRDFPDGATRLLAWASVAYLALSAVVLWYLGQRHLTGRAGVAAAVGALVSDCLTIGLFIWAFAYEDPYVTWSLVVLPPIEGAVRFRTWGAVAGAVFSYLAFLGQAPRRNALAELPLQPTTYIYVAGLVALVAGVTSILVEVWHRQNQAYREQALALADADAVKDRLLAVTSHEFRGSLTAITAGVALLRKRHDRMTPEMRERTLALVGDQAEHLRRLVDDLLTASRLRAGAVSLVPQWGDLRATVERALVAASRKRGAHDLHVAVDPVRCEVDQERLAQVLRNLVENAYAYAPDGTVTVRGRRLHAESSRAAGIELVVSDEGPGIPPERREEVFAPYTRLHEGGSGTGLGLYVVQQVLEAMRGTLELGPGPGTTWTLRIPCPTADPEAAEAADDVASTGSPAPVGWSSHEQAGHS